MRGLQQPVDVLASRQNNSRTHALTYRGARDEFKMCFTSNATRFDFNRGKNCSTWLPIYFQQQPVSLKLCLETHMAFKDDLSNNTINWRATPWYVKEHYFPTTLPKSLHPSICQPAPSVGKVFLSATTPWLSCSQDKNYDYRFWE